MGTQTSKPLFGDEERRNRFRRPRTPVQNNSAAAAAAVASSADDNMRTWPCSNCHATVSNEETRCPYCGGIQVKVKIPRSPMSTTKGINSNLLLERLSTPTTPVTRKKIDASKVHAFLSESATTSTMDYDEEEEDEEEGKDDRNNNRPASALSQASSLSQNFNNISQSSLPASPPFGNSPVPFSDRPPDPVALTLEAAQVRSGAPSPQVVLESTSPKRKASSVFEVPTKKVASSP